MLYTGTNIPISNEARMLVADSRLRRNYNFVRRQPKDYSHITAREDRLNREAVVMRLTETESVCENVAPPTVGQFTGLYDKNGKEIYEGDIILERLKGKRKDGDQYEIVFEECQWFGKNEYGSRTSLSLLQDFHEIKVIGNIHDNPELLKTE